MQDNLRINEVKSEVNGNVFVQKDSKNSIDELKKRCKGNRTKKDAESELKLRECITRKESMENLTITLHIERQEKAASHRLDEIV